MRMRRLRPLPWVHDDGGRAAAGYRGTADDCVARAVAIGTGLPYQEVYNAINREAQRERPGAARRRSGRSSARTGVFRPTTRRYLTQTLGWTWHPTMGIGTGCQVHLAMGELPAAPVLIAQVSKHLVAVFNGVMRDNHDPSRSGTRCVYGYFLPPGS